MRAVTVALLLVAAVAATTVRGRTSPGRRPWRDVRTARTSDRAEIDAAVVMDLLTVAIASGAAIVQAVDVVGAAVGGRQGRRLRTTARALRLGTAWDRAWGDHPLGVQLEPAWSDGVDPTALLLQAARSIRSERRAAARAAAARLGVRLVLPVGLCLLPAFVLLGLLPVLLSSGFDLLG